MNSQWILNIFSSKFTSRNLILLLSHVCGETTARPIFCRTSAVVLTFFFLPLHSRPFIYRKVRAISFAQNRFSSYIKTYYKTPAKLKILTKHIEFPRLYSFSILWILNNFQECACSPCPVNNLLMRKKRRFCWCVWNPRNITGFVLSIDAINELFFVFRRRRFVSNNGGVVFDFFCLTSVFVFLKCPEVRLGICFWLDVRRRGVQRLV